MADLSIEFCGVRAPNPFWLASAPPTNSEYQVKRAFDAGWGGAVWKTLSHEPIVNVSSRYGAVDYDGRKVMGLNNIELITDRTLDVNLREVASVKKAFPKHALFVSLMVESKREVWHDIVKLTQMWYFVQCSAQDEKARKFPLPDELTGELIRYVAAHEVGHTLGLRHNHRASQAYSISQLRDPEFCKKNGNVASIMSYGRYNYVAQPEDGIKCLIPGLAPYDYFAINWGYRPIPDAKTAEDEKKTLDGWAAKQIGNPFLRFGGEDGPAAVDPTVLTENIGNDPVQATALGLKNVDRVMDHLIAASTENGENFELLDGWEERYRYLVDLGKALAPMAPEDKTEGTKVEGCMSQVWMVGRPAHDPSGQLVLTLSADSDAIIVRGLIAVLMSVYDHKSPAEILATDIGSLFDDLGFGQHITLNRRNGFYAMVQRIRREASLLAQAPLA